MEGTITQHLQKLTITPRSDDWYKKVAGKIGKPQPTPGKAKVAVRSFISEGQKKASNDNHQGLDRQVTVEAQEQQGKGPDVDHPLKHLEGIVPGARPLHLEPILGYMYDPAVFSTKGAEQHVRKMHKEIGRPRKMKKRIVIPLKNIKSGMNVAIKSRGKGWSSIVQQ